MQLRRKLFLVLSLMAMVPLLFLLFEVVGRMERDLEVRTASELYKTLAKMGQEISTLMDTQRSLALGLSRVPVVRDFADAVERNDTEAYERKVNQLALFFLNYQSTVPSIQALRFTDVNGKTLVKIKEGHLVTDKRQEKSGRSIIEDIARKPFFRWARSSDQNVVVSDFERGQVAGAVDFCPAMVRYTVPIRDEVDTLQGLLTINVWGRRVDDAVQAALGGYPGKAYIVELNDNPERDGIYLYHENPDWRFANQLGTNHRLSTELGDALWRQIKTGATSGMVRADGDRMLFYRKYAPYKDRDTRWLLVIEAARQTMLAPVAALRHWIGYLIAAVLVLSLLIARWAAARLAHPVHDLAEIITRYADGDQQARYRDQRNDEIGTAGKAFNYLSDSLERANREREKAELAMCQSERLAAIGQMAAGIGHEVNNPLMNIMSLASLIGPAIPEGDRQAHEDLAALQSEGRRCAGVVQGILNFARETQPRYDRFDFAKLVDDTAALFRHRLAAATVFLDLDLERPLMVVGDSSQLQQVLVNILLNAIQASPANSRISVNAYKAGEVLKVEMLDNGSGLSKEAESRLFNPFFTTKPEGSGTGLGLSVSYGIIQKHGGTITLENRQQGGVCALITLPLDGRSAAVKAQVREATNAD